MDLSSSSPVHLVVRSVYTPSQSLALTVDPQTLVGELKHRLSVEFPSRPAAKRQKLIFGGKVCNDEEPLSQVLVKMESREHKDADDQDSVEPVVFHLLVHASGVEKKERVEEKAPVPRPMERHEAIEAQDSPRPSTRRDSVLEPPSFSMPAQYTLDEPPATAPLQQPQHEQQHLFRQSMLMQQQMLVLQQIQYLQCMLMQQRHQHAMNDAPDSQQPYGAYFVPPYNHCYGMMQPQMVPARASVQAAQAPVHVPGPAPTQTPAAEAAAVPRERPMLVEMACEAFSLLDFRLALKMAFMLFIIGQDTAFGRLCLLGLLALVSYLYLTGILAKMYAIYNHRRGRNGAVGPDDPVALDAQAGAAAGAGAAIANRYGSLMRVLRISAERGFVHDVKYFVVGLFLSLVPAWHPQPNQGAAPVPVPDNAPLQEI